MMPSSLRDKDVKMISLPRYFTHSTQHTQGVLDVILEIAVAVSHDIICKEGRITLFARKRLRN